MEDKNYNEKSQKIINKIKYIKNLSPSNKDSLLRKKISEEKNDKNNNNINKVSLSPFNHTHIQKPISTEKELFRDRINKKSKEKEKEKNISINKSKNLTPLIHKYKKKNFYDNHNNYMFVKNPDESIEKKNKLYENQREPSFLNKYMAKVRENEMGEGKNFDNKNEERKMNGNYSYRGNSKNKENIMDLIEIMTRQYQQNKKKEKNDNNYKDIDKGEDYEIIKDNNPINNLEEKNKDNNDGEKKENYDLNAKDDGHLKNVNNYNGLNEENTEIENGLLRQEGDISFKKANENNDIKNEKKTHIKIKSLNDASNNNYQKIKFENNIKLDNLNIFVNEIPKQNSREKIFKNSPKNKNQKNRNMNKSVELRNKNIIIPNINIVKISNSSMNNNYHINNEENNKIDSKQPKNIENNKKSDINKENTNNKNKIPKLFLNSKTIKQNSMTERSQNKNNNDNINFICLLCNKKCKKPLKCPKCFKIYCEQCIKNKKKKNKFCSSCNYYLNDITKYIEIKNINNKRNIKNKINKEIKDTTDDSLNHMSGAGHNMIPSKTNLYSHSKTRSLIEQTPKFTQKNKSEKKSQKTKNKIKINGDKNISSHKKENLEGDENNKKSKKMNDNKKINERNKNKKLNDYSRNKINNTTGEKIKKEKIKQNESIDLNEFDINKDKDKDMSIIENENKNKNEDMPKEIITKDLESNNNETINNKEEIIKEDNNNINNEFNNNEQDSNNINNEINKYEEDNNNGLYKIEKNNEDNNDNNITNDKEEKEKDRNICFEHNNELKYYCFQCDKEFCEECLNNHYNEHNLIDYINNDYYRLKELILKKRENNNKNNILQNYLNNFEQKIKMYKLEEEIFISEINRIANNYIIDIESKISEIKALIDKIKNEQNVIIENNKIIAEYFNYFYKQNNENNINNINYEEFISNNKIAEISPVNYAPEIQKLNNNKNIFKFNYFTCQTIHDIQINYNSNIILFSKIFFDDNNLNNFIHDLKNSNNIISINNENFSDIKNIIFDKSNINFDSFSIKNYNGEALIQVNINLNKNNEYSNENIFYDNIKCYLLISNKEINNYCELDKKMISNGNLCLYNLILWEKFNIFIYNNLCFKILLFNHYK